MIVLGEAFTDDAATLSRGALYFVRKNDRCAPALFREALGVPWGAYAYHLHQQARHLSDADHAARFELAETHVDAAAPSISPRLRHALTFIAYGLLTLQADVGDGVFSDELIESVLRCGVATTLEGGAETATNIETFLEQLGAVASGHLRPDSLVSPAVHPDQIIIRASPSVSAVTRSLGAKAAISNNRLLIRYAKESGFFEAGQTHKSVKRENVRGLRLDLTRVPGRCDVSALEYLNEQLRGYGKEQIRGYGNVTSYAIAA